MNLKKPKFWDFKKPNLIAYILLPFAFLLQYLNNFFKRNNPHKFKIKTVCVGNIYIGGTGKTSLSIQINKILNEKNITAASNWGGSVVFNSYDFLRDGCEEDLDFEAGVGCLYAKFEGEIELAKNTDELLDHLNVLMMSGGMSDDMRAVIADHIEPFDPNDEQQRLYRVAEATYLMWMSPEFAVQR